KRLGEPAVNSPTITLPDAPKTRANVKATKALTDEEIAQNGVPVGDDEQIPPTIAVPDSVAAAPKETFAPGDIPITKTAPTGDLSDEKPETADEDAADDEAKELGIGASPQDYGSYVLPKTEFLTEAPPHIEHKE